MPGLEEQIKVVAEAREGLDDAKDKKAFSFREWEYANREMLARVAYTATAVSVAETLLRELTLKAYAETGDKNPANGVAIRDVSKLAYDTAEAFSWCTEHKMALKLDVSAFEKIVKATPLDFVTISTEAQATIATNLEEK